MMNEVYILSAAHISAQEPFSEEWMDNPVIHNEEIVNAIDLNYKEYLAPNVARRMGKLLKRALVCARTAMEQANVEMPDAIITATGLGCIENTEFFLDAMVREGEKLLNPTPFMQSTHNTIGSTIGLDLKCHGYNTHYSQKYVSFDCGLQDAFMQLQNKNIHTVLLNAHDEHSPIFDSILKHLDCWHFNNGGFKGEVAVSMVLSNQQSPKTLCCVEDMLMCYKPSVLNLQTEFQKLLERNNINLNEIDAVFVGVNGNENNDSVYFANAEILFPNLPLVRYKHLFGEHFTSSGLGVYAAATCLQQERIPQHLLITKDKPLKQLKRLLFYNHSENKEHTIILLTNEK
jgi:3-oxoacyl-(acyl-carrier-protein) synthase